MPRRNDGKPPARIVIEDVRPTVDCGRFPVKRSAGDVVRVSATVFTHGHEVVGAAVRYRRSGVSKWSETVMWPDPDGPDRFAGEFVVGEPGLWEYGVVAWVDRIATWRGELRRHVEGGQTDLDAELAEGARLLGVDSLGVEDALASEASNRDAPTAGPTRAVDVDPELARFGAWYELFPRSFGGLAGVEAQLPRLAGLGFDVVYLTPIHPIGVTDRKGPDNALRAARGRPRQPVGDRRRRGWPHRDPPRPRHDRRLRPPRRDRARARARDRARLRDPVLARSSLARASTPSGSRGGPTAR